MKKVWVTLSMLVVAVVCAIALQYVKPRPTTQPANPLGEFFNIQTEGFAPVEPGWKYVFPDDHGAHPVFQTDTWYFTGSLTTEQGRQFAFQMTFFRLALAPDKPSRESAWATNEIYRAHVAITDVDQKQFHAFERYSRAALDLAGAEQTPVRVWLENWEMLMPDKSKANFHLRVVTDDMRLTLNLESLKSAVTNFDTGTSNPPFHAYWLPRLQASGALEVGADTFIVDGSATLSHVWGTGTVSLYRGQLAFNRFALQLDDNREILVFQLRRRDGSAEPINTGLLISHDGAVRRLRRHDLTLEVLDHWQSAEDGARYPSRWRLQIPAEGIQLDIIPLLEDQELNLSVRYWSGAARVTGKSKDQLVSGTGQVQLTAYAPDAFQLKE